MRSPQCREASVFLDREAGRAVSYLHRVGSHETFLYFHGLGGGKHDFLGAWNVPEWTRYTLVAFDAPGCGATRDESATLAPGVSDIVRTAEALVAHLGLGGLTVIGHSMGGLAGLLFAVRNQGLTRRFVSVEGNLGPDDCSIYSRDARNVQGADRQRAHLEALVETMERSGAAGLAEAASQLRENVRGEAFFSYCRSIVRHSDHDPLLDDLMALGRPRLYVHGDANADLPHIPRLSEGGVSVASIPGSGHFPMHTNPEGLYKALVRFVGSTGA